MAVVVPRRRKAALRPSCCALQIPLMASASITLLLALASITPLLTLALITPPSAMREALSKQRRMLLTSVSVKLTVIWPSSSTKSRYVKPRSTAYWVSSLSTSGNRDRRIVLHQTTISSRSLVVSLSVDGMAIWPSVRRSCSLRARRRDWFSRVSMTPPSLETLVVLHQELMV